MTNAVTIDRDDVGWLETLHDEVLVDEPVRIRAQRALEAMIAL